MQECKSPEMNMLSGNCILKGIMAEEHLCFKTHNCKKILPILSLYLVVNVNNNVRCISVYKGESKMAKVFILDHQEVKLMLDK